LLLVGSGPLEKEVTSLAAGDSRIVRAPFRNQSEMPATYAAGDVLVLPSRGRSETWGLAVNEAFCLGRPVIVSDAVGCHEDLVTPGRTGWIFRSGDRGALAKTLRSAWERRTERAQLAQAVRDQVDRYHYRETTAGLLQALTQTCAEPAMPV
jgi:glycosyltransferase involved in cell wall biosynthesis